MDLINKIQRPRFFISLILIYCIPYMLICIYFVYLVIYQCIIYVYDECTPTIKIESLLEKNKHYYNIEDNDTFLLDFGELLHLDFDEYYVFPEYSTPDIITDIIEVSYSRSVPEYHDRFIFLKNKKIVYTFDTKDGIFRNNVYFNPITQPKIAVKKIKHNSCEFHYINSTDLDSIKK